MKTTQLLLPGQTLEVGISPQDMKPLMINSAKSILRGSIHPTFDKSSLQTSRRSIPNPADSSKRGNSRIKIDIETNQNCLTNILENDLSPLSNINKSNGHLFKIDAADPKALGKCLLNNLFMTKKSPDLGPISEISSPKLFKVESEPISPRYNIFFLSKREKIMTADAKNYIDEYLTNAG
jgi:hypothetical protein